jgi:hypothetical protein
MMDAWVFGLCRQPVVSGNWVTPRCAKGQGRSRQERGISSRPRNFGEGLIDEIDRKIWAELCCAVLRTEK